MDDSWILKEYPEEKKLQIDKLIESTKQFRDELDKLDGIIANSHTTPDGEVVLDWARKASGCGNYLRKVYNKLSAMVRNEEAARIMQIKMECDNNNIKFVSGAAEKDAVNYCKYLRMARNVVEAYVVSSDNVISVCRLHLGYIKNQEIE